MSAYADPTPRELFLERCLSAAEWHQHRLLDRLKVAEAAEQRLYFLQKEGYAWTNEFIDRHRKICADKRNVKPEEL